MRLVTDDSEQILDGQSQFPVAMLVEQWPQAHVRLFAAWLRAHPAARDRYATLKLDLVEHGIWDSRYTGAKSQFVLEIVNKARALRGLAPIAGCRCSEYLSATA